MTINTTEHKDQETFQNSEEFKSKAKSRYKIETRNSELKPATTKALNIDITILKY